MIKNMFIFMSVLLFLVMNIIVYGYMNIIFILKVMNSSSIG